jgi:hypothetical protein
MVVRFVLVMMVVTGCVAEDKTITISSDSTTIHRNVRVQLAEVGFSTLSDSQPSGPDICQLAAELPADTMCSMICDIDAMKAELLATGHSPGVCYEFSCTMTDGTSTAVGVCLPPPN